MSELTNDKEFRSCVDEIANSDNMCTVFSKYLKYICWEGISRLPISDLLVTM